MKIKQKMIGFISLAWLSGCASLVPKVPSIYCLPKGQNYNPPDLNLTLVRKDMPKRYIDAFTRAELAFSTNQSQRTHAILNPQLTEEMAIKIQDIPLGTTMKESEWDKLIFTRKKENLNQVLRIGNWQRFY